MYIHISTQYKRSNFHYTSSRSQKFENRISGLIKYSLSSSCFNLKARFTHYNSEKLGQIRGRAETRWVNDVLLSKQDTVVNGLTRQYSVKDEIKVINRSNKYFYASQACVQWLQFRMINKPMKIIIIWVLKYNFCGVVHSSPIFREISFL